MRRFRALNPSETGELAAMFAILVAGFVGLAAAWQSGFIPSLMAFTKPNVPALQAHEFHAQPVAAQPTVQISAPAVRPLTAQPVALSPLPPVAPALVTVRPIVRAQPEIKIYDGEKYRYVRTLHLRVTAYAPDRRCCWPYDGTTTASGLSVKTNHGHLVAADTRLIPMGCLVSVPGYHQGTPVPVLDRGGAIKGHRLDVLLPSFGQAQEWGSRSLDVKIYEPVDD